MAGNKVVAAEMVSGSLKKPRERFFRSSGNTQGINQ